MVDKTAPFARLMVGGKLINRFSLTLDSFGALQCDFPSWRAADDEQQTLAHHDAERALAERDLVQRASDGNLEALAKLYDVYAPALHRVLVAILSSHEDAEDALQETFVKLLDGKMGRAQNVRAYLFTSARHIALDTLRRRKREQNYAAEIVEEIAPQNDDLQTLLQLLPMEQREVIALKVFQQMTFQEIAAVVKARPNTVASRYRYGIEKLRQLVREENDD